jgi:hypothetical protein
MYDQKWMVARPLLPTGGFAQPNVPDQGHPRARQLARHQGRRTAGFSGPVGAIGGKHE